MSAESVSESVTGVYEPLESRGGWLRTSPDFSIRPADCFVSATIVSSNGLRGGERVVGRSASGNGSRRQLAEITSINELAPSDYLERPVFESLTPIDPCKAIRFETPGGPATMRVVDLMTPIGFGQRGLIVAPPRTGKTILLQQMAQGIAANHPDARLIMLLIDERPEEVTHMQRSVRGEVIASSNDKDIESHVRLARLVIDRSKRLVEAGLDVVILMDSLTRLGRAFNAHIRGSGRIMSGGLDIRALTEPKSIFGAARKIEHGGSLTIIASALVDTGSRMDEVIFNEFKGTGNMEIMLSRSMADRRIWPAIDVKLSGTRREELLLAPAALTAAHRIRRSLVSETPERAMELLLETMQKYPTNTELVEHLRSTSPRPGGRGI
jgi:transcription termination factor Rho